MGIRPRTLRDEVMRARAATNADWTPQRSYFDLEARGSIAVKAEHTVADEPSSSNLPRNFIVERLPRDLLVHIAVNLHSTRELARLDSVCHAFHSAMGYGTSVVADALRIRAVNDGAAMAATTTTDSDADASNACLLRDEALRELAKRLVTVVDGMPLRLSIDTNSGYHAVTFNEWASPYRYKACVDGVTLGSFPTAAAAACAVCQYEWVQRNPCL